MDCALVGICRGYIPGCKHLGRGTSMDMLCTYCQQAHMDQRRLCYSHRSKALSHIYSGLHPSLYHSLRASSDPYSLLSCVLVVSLSGADGAHFTNPLMVICYGFALVNGMFSGKCPSDASVGLTWFASLSIQRHTSCNH